MTKTELQLALAEATQTNKKTADQTEEGAHGFNPQT
jgi:hypothetical protein